MIPNIRGYILELYDPMVSLQNEAHITYSNISYHAKLLTGDHWPEPDYDEIDTSGRVYRQIWRWTPEGLEPLEITVTELCCPVINRQSISRWNDMGAYVADYFKRVGLVSTTG